MKNGYFVLVNQLSMSKMTISSLISTDDNPEGSLTQYIYNIFKHKTKQKGHKKTYLQWP